MKYFIIFLLLNGVLIIHELSHAIAMWRNKVEIAEIGLGLPLLPFRLSIKFRKIRFSVYPLLIGAFVRPAAEDELEKLPFSKQLKIYWSGPFANLLTGLICFPIYYFVVFSHYIFSGPHIISPFYVFPIIELFLIVFIGGILIYLPFRLKNAKFRPASFLIPMFGIVIYGLIVWSIASGGLNSLMGPIGAVAELPDMFLTFELGFFLVFIVLSVAIGFFNILPLPPLDGGKIMTAFLKTKGTLPKDIKLLNFAGTALITALICAATIQDIFRLLGKILFHS